MKVELLIAAFVLGAGFLTKRADAQGPPAVGQQAPEFTLLSQDGSQVSLKDFLGKWVVLYFYPKDNTPGCTIEANNFQRDLEKFEKVNAVILGVSLDSADSHKAFCTKQGLTFKLLADTEKKVAAQYGSLRSLLVVKIAERNTFLIDPQGKIVRVWIGVSPSSHSTDVLSTLKNLGAGKG